MRRSAPRVRLIDDTGFLVPRVRDHEPKPGSWFRSSKHLKWVRFLPCILVGDGECMGPVEAAHVRKGTDGGMGEKPSDIFVLPLCQWHHRVQHMVGEVSFHEGSDPIKRALELAVESPCVGAEHAAMVELANRYV